MNTVFTSDELDRMGEIIWILAENRGKIRNRACVLDLITSLVAADYAASFIWDERRQTSAHRCSCNISERHLDAYEEYFHKIDVVTPVMRLLAEPSAVDRAINRKLLVHSEFYTDFLTPAGMHHGLNVFFFHEGQDIGDLRIWRHAKAPPFTSHEELILRELTPYFVKSLAPALTSVRGLSEREQQVARLVARGASDKEVARELGIGFATVRTHLSNAMGKLSCANRTQLARHF